MGEVVAADEQAAELLRQTAQIMSEDPAATAAGMAAAFIAAGGLQLDVTSFTIAAPTFAVAGVTTTATSDDDDYLGISLGVPTSGSAEAAGEVVVPILIGVIVL